MTRGALWKAGLTGVVAAIAATLPHAASAAKVPGRHAPKQTLSLDTDRFRTPGLTAFAPPLLDTARFTFTAPGRGASTARVDTVERAFRFTPSGQPGRKALSVGVTSRVTAAPAADPARVAAVESFSVAPAAYNVGLSVGWRGFSVGGGYTRYDAPVTALGPNRREAVDASFGYRGKNWKTALQVAAETGSAAAAVAAGAALFGRSRRCLCDRPAPVAQRRRPLQAGTGIAEHPRSQPARRLGLSGHGVRVLGTRCRLEPGVDRTPGRRAQWA